MTSNSWVRHIDHASVTAGCWTLALALACLLSACASYTPQPLVVQASLHTALPALPPLSASGVAPPFVAPHPFDARDGLDATEVATLAVLLSPDVKSARAAQGVAQAQAFAAGLLPDPQLSLTRDFPSSNAPGLTSAFNLGLAYDFNQLITHGVTQQASASDTEKSHLDLLWQEWQVVAQSQVLMNRIGQQEQLAQVLEHEQAFYADLMPRTRRAVAEGNLTIEALSPYLTTAADNARQLNEARRAAQDNRGQLNALLGLMPDVRLDLVFDRTLPQLNDAAVRASLISVAERRPDLRALRAGYAAQEARTHRAVLAQFPALNIGITRVRDTAGLYTSGFALGFTLPLFNRNRGNIAVEVATRTQLRQEYEKRLNAAHGDALRALRSDAQLMEQIRLAQGEVAQLQPLADRGEQALQAGAMDALRYANLRAGLLAKKLELLNLEASVREQRIALRTLTGIDVSNGLHAPSDATPQQNKLP